MMILGLKQKTQFKLIEVVGLPGTGKSIATKACAIRTGSTYFNLPELDFTQPIDRCLMSSLNNISSLISEPEQWGDIYFSYLKRIEQTILQQLEFGDVWVTNYIHTLNFYQSALKSKNRYKLSVTPKKVYVDLPIIQSYKYENLDFFNNYKSNILDFKKSLKTTLSFVNKKHILTTNPRMHPAKYLNTLSLQICGFFKYKPLPYTIPNEYFIEKE